MYDILKYILSACEIEERNKTAMTEFKKMRAVKGEVTVPGDKSISHRAVMLGALADGDTHIDGFLMGADCLSTIDCFRKLGIDTEVDGGRVCVHGKGADGLRAPNELLYTGNSGTTTRLLCGILSAQNFDSTISGDESICRRPMGRVTRPLAEMGAKIDGEYCPLKIHASRLHGIEYHMPVASAQVKTALLLAGLFADGETLVHEIDKSRNHTELMLEAMGADIETNGLDVRVSGRKRLSPIDIHVPGDISSAAYFIAAASIMKDSQLLIKNVGMNETRTGIIDVAKAMGADITYYNMREENREPVCDILVKSAELHAVNIGGSIIPRLIDEIPVIAVMAACAEGETVIKDAAELKVKESNRIASVCRELAKCGIDITETDDGMIIRGGGKIKAAAFESYKDHRIAMSLAVLAQVADGECSIDDVDCVRISYPAFFEDFYALEDK